MRHKPRAKFHARLQKFGDAALLLLLGSSIRRQGRDANLARLVELELADVEVMFVACNARFTLLAGPVRVFAQLGLVDARQVGVAVGAIPEARDPAIGTRLV